MNAIRVVGFDPSTAHFGACRALVDIDTLEIKPEEVLICETESAKKKGVRKDSDDLRRFRELQDFVRTVVKGCSLAISEVPFFSPGAYAAANYSSGAMVATLAMVPIPLIQVSPRDVKLAAIGHPQAAKEEMIEWAVARYPELNWPMRKVKGVMKPMNCIEHMADALAAVLAGVQHEQFAQALTMFRSMKVAA